MLVLALSTFLASLLLSAYAASRTSAPSGAIVVNPTTTTSGQFKTLSSAVASLPDDSSSQTIFIFPGTYKEQVLIDRAGPVTVSRTIHLNNTNRHIITHQLLSDRYSVIPQTL